MNDISRALTNERGFIKFSAAALGEAEQSLEANLNNPLRSWDGRDRVGAATARKPISRRSARTRCLQ